MGLPSGQIAPTACQVRMARRAALEQRGVVAPVGCEGKNHSPHRKGVGVPPNVTIDTFSKLQAGRVIDCDTAVPGIMAVE